MISLFGRRPRGRRMVPAIAALALALPNPVEAQPQVKLTGFDPLRTKSN
ncbi:hypothetical protein [Inquilinus sp. CA228]